MVSFGHVKREAEDYEDYKRRKAEEEAEKQKKKLKVIGSEKMNDEKEPTAEQLAEQEAQVREDMTRFKAMKKGESVHVREHHRRHPASAKEETEDEEEKDEEEEK